MTPTEHASANLRALRKASRLTQRDLIDRLNDALDSRMAQAVFSRKESGERPLTIDELFRLAAALDVSPLDLLLPRAPGAVLSVAPGLTVDGPEARSWVRGRRRLSKFDGPAASALELSDESVMREVAKIDHQLAVEACEIRVLEHEVGHLRSSIEESHRQPSLFPEASTTPHLEERLAEFEQELETRRDTRRRLERDRARQISEALHEGWIDDEGVAALDGREGHEVANQSQRL